MILVIAILIIVTLVIVILVIAVLIIVTLVIVSGIAQWLERRTRARNVMGLSPRRSGGRIFFSGVNFLC